MRRRAQRRDAAHVAPDHPSVLTSTSDARDEAPIRSAPDVDVEHAHGRVDVWCDELSSIVGTWRRVERPGDAVALEALAGEESDPAVHDERVGREILVHRDDGAAVDREQKGQRSGQPVKAARERATAAGHVGLGRRVQRDAVRSA